MKNYKKVKIGLLLLVTCILVGCGNTGETDKADARESVKTFSDWAEHEVFQDVPAMLLEETRIGKSTDYGAGTYVIDVRGTSLDDYRSYLTLLEEQGFEKYADNGTEGVDGCVFTSTYTKDKKVLTITHMVKTNMTYISASEEMNLSTHLFYKDESVANNVEGATTSLHLLELHTYGDSYVIRMKNGKFILVDGGMEQDARYLLDYLESLVPKGEKPVIEGWFVTHGHNDHIGAFAAFADNAKYAERIVVEGVYFTEPSKAVCINYGIDISDVKYGTLACRASDGKPTKVYRPQTGQRYYFNDITIDILHTQEQLLLDEYDNGFNDTSSWLLFTIDGQTFLDAGDASEGAINVVKRTYNQEFFNLDMLSVFHHGQNVYDSYVNYFNYKTAIYPTFVVGSQTAGHREEENVVLQQNAVECISWGDGTKVLTFPYKLGTAESRPMREWIYTPDRKTPVPYSQ